MTRPGARLGAAGADDPLLTQGGLRAFLRTHRLPPLDRFGQHFLIDRDILAEIVSASEPDPAVPVIEVGAGLGVLTRALAQVREQGVGSREQGSAPLIAVEVDRRLIPILTERVRPFPSVRVVHADILRVNPSSLLPTPSILRPRSYDIIGNIPYNITAKLLERFLAHAPRPRRMTLLLDEAVAAVIAAQPPYLSIRAIAAQVYAEPRVVRGGIPPTAFVPKPAVRSALVTFRTRRTPLVTDRDARAFFRLVRAGFSQKRKTLANALAATERIRPALAAERLRGAGIDPTRRAQTLSIAEWKALLLVWSSTG